MEDDPEYLVVTKLWYLLKLDGRPQWQIAQSSNLSRTHISVYAHGHRPIPSSHLPTLCTTLNCSPSDITGTMAISSTTLLNNAFSKTG